VGCERDDDDWGCERQSVRLPVRQMIGGRQPRALGAYCTPSSSQETEGELRLVESKGPTARRLPPGPNGDSHDLSTTVVNGEQ